MAAALQKQAPPSGILISANTRELCTGELDVEPVRDADALANFKTTVFALRGRPSNPSAAASVDTYPFPIVGRDSELRLIAETLGREHVAARVISIIGEPGIGKKPAGCGRCRWLAGARPECPYIPRRHPKIHHAVYRHESAGACSTPSGRGPGAQRSAQEN